MTNKEIAKKVANIIFTQEDGTPDSDAFALRTLIETLNSPSKYSSGVGYYRENLETAILDLLKDKRRNGVHFMDLSEKMESK